MKLQKSKFLDILGFWAVAAVFTVAAVARLNPACLLEPDSSDYLLMARTIAVAGEYRAPYDPSGLPFSWRPPGLSVILAPVALLWPGDVVACKVCVLAFGLISLRLLFGLARDTEDPRPALIVTMLVASNPLTLFWSTEVLSEPVYLAGTLAILAILGGRSRARPTHLAFAGLLLGVLPLVRTVGLSLTMAAAVWLLLVGPRRSLLLVLPLACAPYLIWRTLLSPGGQPSYVSFLSADLSQSAYQDLSGRLVSGTLLNLGQLLRVLTPGGLSGIPVFSYASRYPATWPIGAEALAMLIGCSLLVLCGIGMWHRRWELGGLSFIYIAIYISCLAFWPSRHDRLMWPLLPPLFAHLPAGFRAVVRHLEGRSAALGRAVRGSWLLIAGLMIGWQTFVSAGVVATNLDRVLRPGAREDELLPPYYADWRAAGRWLNENSLPFERVVTGHADLFCTSGRFQQPILFGSDSLEGKLRALPARYLALPVGIAGSFLPPSCQRGDWLHEFRVVYQRGGVAILEIRPNRRGTIARASIDREAAILAVTSGLRREPWRFDLRAARAMLLDAAGRSEESFEEYRRLAKDGRADCPTLVRLSLNALEAGRFAESSRLVKAAAAQPESEVQLQQIQALRQLSAAGLDGAYAGEVALPNRIAQAWSLARQYRLDEASASFDEILESHPSSGVAAMARGEFRQRTGILDRGRSDFERALRLGEGAAEAKLEAHLACEALDRNRTIHQAVGRRIVRIDPASPESHLHVAELLIGDGVGGRALEVLERAVARFPGRTDLLIPLANLHCDFANPREAERLYHIVLTKGPRNTDAIVGLERVADLLRVPEISFGGPR